jgi:hypothetical protein
VAATSLRGIGRRARKNSDTRLLASSSCLLTDPIFLFTTSPSSSVLHPKLCTTSGARGGFARSASEEVQAERYAFAGRMLSAWLMLGKSRPSSLCQLG